MSAAPRPDEESGPSLTPALTPAFPHRAAWGTAPSLRAWQQQAMEKYFDPAREGRAARDFLAVATPGAGKTTFALSVAAELLGRRIVDRIIVVAPTDHLKTQWAEASARAPASPSTPASRPARAAPPRTTSVSP